MSTTAKVWLHSLAAAAIGGGASALLSSLAMPDTFNLSPSGLVNLGKAALIGILVPVLTLLKQSPLPPDDLPPASPNAAASKVVALLLAMTVLFGTLPTTGCTISSATVASDGAAIGQAMLSIAAQLSVTDPAVAARITTAANALTAITSNWTVGSGVTLFNDAANAAEVVLSVIPLTAPYASLVSFAVAAIDILIANLNPTSTTAAVKASLAQNEPANLTAYRVLARKQIKHRFGRSLRGDLKAAWNDAVKSNALQPSMAFN